MVWAGCSQDQPTVPDAAQLDAPTDAGCLCSDGDPCTADYCLPNGGCAFSPLLGCGDAGQKSDADDAQAAMDAVPGSDTQDVQDGGSPDVVPDKDVGIPDVNDAKSSDAGGAKDGTTDIADAAFSFACVCGDGNCASTCGETLAACAVDCSVCGDGTCTGGETASNCPGDCCGSCGDGKCKGALCKESPVTCPVDCPGCGDGACAVGENWKSCPADCATGCGNGTCESGESPVSCPFDCCSGGCGDGWCIATENPVTCQADCPGACGDGWCAVGETQGSCPVDCQGSCGDSICEAKDWTTKCGADCLGGCMDGRCAATETPITCPSDCCGGCGDGICACGDCGETATNCPMDCGTACGNSVCEPSEIADCPEDCAVVVGVCGDGVCTPDEGGGVCPTDCPVCGDCICEKFEYWANCPTDCGYCGDGGCSDTCVALDENALTCPGDCAYCGDCICGPGETTKNCPLDCATCGDGACNLCSESKVTCPGDCTATCGDCICQGSETANDCPVDCGFCGDKWCSACPALNESPQTCWQDCSSVNCASGCDDGFPCTTDSCKADGGCLHMPADAGCDDGNACTDDRCQIGKGCVHADNAWPCDDGNPCTTQDHCGWGNCIGPPCAAHQFCAPGTGAGSGCQKAACSLPALPTQVYGVQEVYVNDLGHSCDINGDGQPDNGVLGGLPLQGALYLRPTVQLLIADPVGLTTPGLASTLSVWPTLASWGLGGCAANAAGVCVLSLKWADYDTTKPQPDGTCAAKVLPVVLSADVSQTTYLATATDGILPFGLGESAPPALTPVQASVGALSLTATVKTASDGTVSFGSFARLCGAVHLAAGATLESPWSPWFAQAPVLDIDSDGDGAVDSFSFSYTLQLYPVPTAPPATACTADDECDDGQGCTLDTCGETGCTHEKKACYLNACQEPSGACGPCPAGTYGDGEMGCPGNPACADAVACGCPLGYQAVSVNSGVQCAAAIPVWGERPESPNGLFLDNGDGTLSDAQTKLMWQKNPSASTLSLTQAGNFCQTLTLAGESDWRLPTRAEVATLFDFAATSGFAVPTILSATFWTDEYWTMTPHKALSTWSANFYTVAFHTLSKPNSLGAARCVRETASMIKKDLATRYVVSPSGETTYDTWTERTWQRAAPEVAHTLASAAAYCASLGLAGGGWQLPTLPQLLSLVEDFHGEPRLPPLVFAPAPSWRLVSSTKNRGALGTAWTLSGSTGKTSVYQFGFDPFSVRCVK